MICVVYFGPLCRICMVMLSFMFGVMIFAITFSAGPIIDVKTFSDMRRKLFRNRRIHWRSHVMLILNLMPCICVNVGACSDATFGRLTYLGPQILCFGLSRTAKFVVLSVACWVLLSRKAECHSKSGGLIT